jgi:hypothetical protein
VVFTFCGGCTLIFDLNDLSLKHVISKPIFDVNGARGGQSRKLKLNTKRLTIQYRSLYGDLADKMGFAPLHPGSPEPFAFIHKVKNTGNEW